MWTAPPEGVPYEQWLMDQVAMRIFVAFQTDPQREGSVSVDAMHAYERAVTFMAHRKLVDQGVNKSD